MDERLKGAYRDIKFAADEAQERISQIEDRRERFLKMRELVDILKSFKDEEAK